MILPGRRYSLAARVARIERELAETQPATAGPLSRVEKAELAELERERAIRFPGPIETWDRDRLADFLSWSAGDGHGSARRLDELRQRARPPEEVAEQRAMEIAIGAMSRDQLDAFMEAMASRPPEPAKGNRPCP